MWKLGFVLGIAVAMSGMLVANVPAAEAASPKETASPATDPAARAQGMIDKGLAYLQSRQQPDGGWQEPTDQPAVTALVLKAFVYNHADTRTPFVKKGFDKLLSYQKPSGGIYQDAVANYNTAIAVSALAAAQDPDHQAQLDRAVAFLKKLQWNEDESTDIPERKKITPTDPRFGG